MRRAGQALTVGKGAVDIGVAAQLRAEQHIDRVREQMGEIDDLRVEDHHRGFDRLDGGQHRSQDAGIDHRGRHRAALIDAENDLTQRLSLAAVADARLRDDRLKVGLIVARMVRS